MISYEEIQEFWDKNSREYFKCRDKFMEYWEEDVKKKYPNYPKFDSNLEQYEAYIEFNSGWYGFQEGYIEAIINGQE